MLLPSLFCEIFLVPCFAEEFSNLSGISSQTFPWCFELRLKFSHIYVCLSYLSTVPSSKCHNSNFRTVYILTKFSSWAGRIFYYNPLNQLFHFLMKLSFLFPSFLLMLPHTAQSFVLKLLAVSFFRDISEKLMLFLACFFSVPQLCRLNFRNFFLKINTSCCNIYDTIIQKRQWHIRADLYRIWASAHVHSFHGYNWKFVSLCLD